MPDKTVSGIGGQHFAHAFLDPAPVHLVELLPSVLIHPVGADPEAVLGKSHGSVGKERQHGRVRVGFVHGMRGQRVTRSREGGHGQIIRFHGFPGLRVKPHGTAAGKQEKLALRRQGNEFVRTGRSPLAAAAPHHQQVGIVKNVSLIIGHDHVRLHVFCHLILLTAGKRRQSRYTLLSYRKNCKEAPHPAPAGPMKIFPGASPAAGRGTGPEAPG